MKKMSYTVTVILAFCLALIARAQEVEKTPPAGGNTTRSILGIKPSLEWDARWPIPDFNRTIYIHRADQTQPNRANSWVHRPLFALIERVEPLPGYPAIVSEADKQPGGAIKLTFRARVTTDAFRNHCKRVLLNPDLSHRPPALNSADVLIFPWPMEHVVIDCRISPHDAILATGETGSLVSIGDYITFFMVFSPDNLQTFLDRVDSGGIEFDYRYTFTNRNVAIGEDSTLASRQVNAAVRALFTDEQKKEGAPIFQSDLNRVKMWLSVNAVRTVRSQRPDLLPHLNTDLFVQQIFGTPREVTFRELEGDEKLRAAVAEHLKPLIDVYKQGKVDTTRTEDVKEKEHSQRVKLVAPDFQFGPLDIGSPGEVEITDRDLRRITQETGVTFTADVTKNTYAPQAIRVYRLNLGSEIVEIKGQETIYLATDSLSGYFEESAVPASFTDRTLGDLGASSSPTFYDGIPLGTMLPWFGAGENPPRGYVFADGKETWPTEPWVPLELQGKPVPNMDQQYLVGTSSIAEVGTPIQPGTLKNLNLGAIEVPELVSVGNSPGRYVSLDIKSNPTTGTGHNRSKPERDRIPNADPVVDIYSNLFVVSHPEDFSPPQPGKAVLERKDLPQSIGYKGGNRTVSLGTVDISAAALTPASYRVRFIIRVK